MKVLHVIPTTAMATGGPAEAIRGLLPALAADGIDVSCFTTDLWFGADDDVIGDLPDVKVFHAVRPSSWAFAPSMMRPLDRAIPEADLVHVHSIHTFPSTAAMISARRHGTPYLIEPHGALTSYHLRRGETKKRIYSGTIDRFGLRGLSGAIYSSTREAEDAESLLPLGESHLMTLGVDESLFELTRIRRRGSPQLLYLGRVTAKKRLDLVLRALATTRLREASVSLIVAGPIESNLPFEPIALARELGIADRVTFVGPVDAIRRAELLRESDAFILLSEDESFGMAIAEAMAAGCPVIASANAGITLEAAAAGALRLCALEPEPAAEVIADLLLNDGDPGLSARGREYASARFRWALAAEQAIAAYHSVLAATTWV